MFVSVSVGAVFSRSSCLQEQAAGRSGGTPCPSHDEKNRVALTVLLGRPCWLGPAPGCVALRAL